MPEQADRKELEERIHILEKENEQLAERAEDTLLLGLISETIEQSSGISELLSGALERVSMLKNLPVVACCSVRAGKATVIESYLSFSHSTINNCSFNMPHISNLKELLISNQHSFLAFMQHLGFDFKAKHILMIAFSTSEVPRGVFIFSDQSDDQEGLQQLSPILHRMIDLVRMSMENSQLLKRYKALNQELDQRVIMRTQELHANEHKYRSLIEGSDAAIMLFSDSHFVDCNAATLSMFACDSKEHFFTLNLASISPKIQANGKDSKPLSIKYMDLTIKYGCYRFDWIFKRLNGLEFPADVHLSRVHIDHHDMVQAMVIDNTERVKAEASLRKLSQAIEQASESILITDTAGHIEYVNRAFEELTGYCSDEVIGKNPRILQSDLNPESFDHHLWQTIQSGQRWEKSLIDRRKDGTLYPILMSVSPITDAHGKTTHYVAIQRDMTELKEMEDKFNQAQKMEAVGTLVGGIAHDFNNMLAGIVGSLYLMRSKINNNPELISYINDIEHQSFHAADMIKQLLTFARKGHIKIVALSFTSLMKEGFRLARRTVPENINIQLKVCDQALNIEGDASLLQQVLLNLINNARDAVANVSQPEIYIVVDQFQANESFIAKYPELKLGQLYARLRVSDNGCGIPDDDLKHIFEPYYTSKGVGEGTGLGLSMIYGSIHSHHGLIDVQNRLNQGCSFSVLLPLSEVKDLPQEMITQNEIMMGHGETILCVDDEPFILEMNIKLLSSLGYKILEAVDGVQALEVYAKNRQHISLIITDIIMPNLGGIKLSEAIWKQQPLLPVIFVSGYNESSLSIDTSKQRHSTILQKPYSIKKLSQSIRSLLDII